MKITIYKKAILEFLYIFIQITCYISNFKFLTFFTFFFVNITRSREEQTYVDSRGLTCIKINKLKIEISNRLYRISCTRGIAKQHQTQKRME